MKWHVLGATGVSLSSWALRTCESPLEDDTVLFNESKLMIEVLDLAHDTFLVSRVDGGH